MFPDTRKVLNGPLTGRYNMYPEGGVTVDAAQGDRRAAWAPSPWARSASGAAARALDAKCKVPCEILDLPIGLHATDIFIDTLRRIAGVNVPDSLTIERGRLVDIITDMHQYFYGKRVALVGDPDQLLSLTQFLVAPGHAARSTSSPGPPPGKNMKRPCGKRSRMCRARSRSRCPGDMFLFHQWIKQRKRGPAHRQHLRQVYRQGRGHPLHPLRIPHFRPGRPQLFSHRRLPGGDAASGKDPGRPPGPQDRDADGYQTWNW